MADTKYQQGGHDVVVRTRDGYSKGDTVRETYVDGRGKSISYAARDGTTREYQGVSHGIFGPTPTGGFKK